MLTVTNKLQETAAYNDLAKTKGLVATRAAARGSNEYALEGNADSHCVTSHFWITTLYGRCRDEAILSINNQANK